MKISQKQAWNFIVSSPHPWFLSSQSSASVDSARHGSCSAVLFAGEKNPHMWTCPDQTPCCSRASWTDVEFLVTALCFSRQFCGSTHLYKIEMRIPSWRQMNSLSRWMIILEDLRNEIQNIVSYFLNLDFLSHLGAVVPSLQHLLGTC